MLEGSTKRAWGPQFSTFLSTESYYMALSYGHEQKDLHIQHPVLHLKVLAGELFIVGMRNNGCR